MACLSCESLQAMILPQIKEIGHNSWGDEVFGQHREGVRILVCPLRIKSPWLNAIEPEWIHGKRHVVEPNRALSAQELAEQICVTFGCDQEAHLALPEKVPW